MSAVINWAKRVIGKYLPEKQDVPLKIRELMLKRFYKKIRKNKLDLKNPDNFTEKLQWMKLYYSHPDLQRCVDKYTFKQYVKEKLGDGYTASILKVWSSPEEVSIRDVPANKFVLKSTLQSDGNFIILVKDKQSLDIEKVEAEIKANWFDTRKLLTNSFCSAYYGAKPRVIVEEYVEEFANCANDYKLFCFHGKPTFSMWRKIILKTVKILMFIRSRSLTWNGI